MQSRYFKTVWLINISVAIGLVGYWWLSRRLGPAQWYVNAVAFSPDGETIAVGCYRWQYAPSDYKHLMSGIEHTVKLLDADTGEELLTIEQEPHGGTFAGVGPEPHSWLAF